MRLSASEIQNLKNSTLAYDPAAKLYLFGSRTDAKQKGGDIDILIISREITRQQLREIRLNFFQQFGEQKLDIILDDGTLQTAFTKMIFPQAVKL